MAGPRFEYGIECFGVGATTTVQNTYLSAFQLLGTLGLLLGTIGLGISQLRGAMERRSELAAMRASDLRESD